MKYFLLLTTVLLFGSFSLRTDKQTVKVVIDAGHGGTDPGHLPHQKNLLPEKDINLQISLFLGSYIEKYLDNVEIYYTRKDDSSLSLDERVEKANSNDVDYFLSIHCNGNPKKSVYGTESHIHNFDAKKSYALAKAIEKQFSGRAGRSSRGVKNNDDRAHSIQVLKFTQMTSVLVECGFMTNEKEARYLNSQHGQEIIASAIFRGFRERIKLDFPQISFEKGSSDKGEYTVQIMSSKEPIDTKHESFKNLQHPVNRISLNTRSAYKYIYQLGSFSTKKEADSAAQKARKQGFTDAIVIRK